jgi:hypothetical protein
MRAHRGGKQRSGTVIVADRTIADPPWGSEAPPPPLKCQPNIDSARLQSSPCAAAAAKPMNRIAYSLGSPDKSDKLGIPLGGLRRLNRKMAEGTTVPTMLNIEPQRLMRALFMR